MRQLKRNMSKRLEHALYLIKLTILKVMNIQKDTLNLTDNQENKINDNDKNFLMSARLWNIT